MPFGQQIFLANSHNISKWHPGSRGGVNSYNKAKKRKKTKKKNAEKFFINFLKRRF